MLACSPFIILAGNDDMHGSSEEFEIQPDPTTDCEVKPQSRIHDFGPGRATVHPNLASR